MPVRFSFSAKSREIIIFGGAFTISKNELLINEEIRLPQVRVVDVDGGQLCIMSSGDALELAYSKNVDLVLIAPKAETPVCKLMDYGKYKFEMAKKEKEAKKNQKVVAIKEIRISPSIDDHDFETKVNQATKFLKEGDKVKVTVRFRGREIRHSDLGAKLLDRFKDSLSEVGGADKPAKLEGKNMSIMISPK